MGHKKIVNAITRSLFDVKHINLFFIAFKMLVNNKRKFIGMVIGATFSAFIIMQQPSVYKGITERLVEPIRSIEGVDLWVMNLNSQDFTDPVYYNAMDIYRIRSIPGVLWAKQLYRSWYTMMHPATNKMLSWELIGVDPELLLGLPKTIIAGTRSSIQQSNSILVDGYSLKQLEAPNKRTIQLGDKMVEGRNNWIVTAITKPQRRYVINPKAYMMSNHIPNVASKPSFILVKVNPSFDVRQVAYDIFKKTSFLALTPSQFIDRANQYFSKKTPIVVVFIAIAIIGFVIGLVMMWQIFNNFILTHLHQFGMLKILGVSSSSLIKIVLFQAGITGGIGFLLGLLLAVLFGFIFYDSVVAFHLTWGIILLGAVGSTIVIIFSSCFAILKVLRMDSVELCRDAN